MKWLILLLIVGIVIFLIAMRYRRHLQTALHLWRMFRQIRRASQPKQAAERKIENRKIDRDAPLVRCARCGKWLSPDEALNLRSKTVYCSTACMEKAARIESLVDRN
jgi:hypothetical protein